MAQRRRPAPTFGNDRWWPDGSGFTRTTGAGATAAGWTTTGAGATRAVCFVARGIGATSAVRGGISGVGGSQPSASTLDGGVTCVEIN